MKDPTKDYRRMLIESGQPEAAARLVEKRWTTDELREEFEVLGFAAPFVVVIRRVDGVKGSLEVTHSPRLYFNWHPHDDKEMP